MTVAEQANSVAVTASEHRTVARARAAAAVLSKALAAAVPQHPAPARGVARVGEVVEEVVRGAAVVAVVVVGGAANNSTR